jgi:hypothetical protein
MWGEMYAYRYSPSLTASEKVTFTKQVSTNCFISATPNPFSQQLTINFSNQSGEFVNVVLYSLDGRLIKNLYHGSDIGKKTLHFSRSSFKNTGLAAGIYVLRLSGKEGSFEKKVYLNN